MKLFYQRRLKVLNKKLQKLYLTDKLTDKLTGLYNRFKIDKELSLQKEKIDIVGRWGGEEFLIILPFTSKEFSKKVAENLRVLIEENNFIYNMDRKITISVGVTEFSKSKSVEDTLLLVDNLLYKAKENGRNRVELS